MGLRQFNLIVLSLFLLGAAPSRTQTYTAGQIINPTHVTENEDNIYSYLQGGVDTYDDGSILSAAIANGTITASDIASETLTTSNILDGTLVNADISASAAIAYSKLTGTPTFPVADRVHRTAGDVTTTSTSLVDFTGASITVTTQANPVLVGFTGSCRNDNVGSNTQLNVDIDGTLVLGSAGFSFEQAVTSESQNCSFVAMTSDLTAASHTFKLQWKTSTGTTTMTCDSSTPCNFWIAEVTD